jgi:hypothetical protein
MKVRITLNDWADHGVYTEVEQEHFFNHESIECKAFIEKCWKYLSTHMLADFQIECEEYWRS